MPHDHAFVVRGRFARSAWWSVVLVLCAACSSPSSPSAPPVGSTDRDAAVSGAPVRCVAGASAACVCADARTGAQVCTSDGAFGACSCSGAAGPRCVENASAACTCTDGRTGAQVCTAVGAYAPCVCLSTSPPDAAPVDQSASAMDSPVTPDVDLHSDQPPVDVVASEPPVPLDTGGPDLGTPEPEAGVAIDAGIDVPVDRGTDTPLDTSADRPVDVNCPVPTLPAYLPPSPTPSCRPVPCSSYASACGILSDQCNGTVNCGTCAPPTLRFLDLPANDLVWDPTRRVVYLSLPSSAGLLGNRVVAVDPVTATVTRSFFVGSEPNPLALSDDASLLWVGLDGSNTVRTIDLTAGTVGVPMVLNDIEGDAVRAMDLEAMPGAPRSVVVVRARGTSVLDLRVLDDRAFRPVSARGAAGSVADTIRFVTSTALVGINTRNSIADFSLYGLCASGLTFVGASQNTVSEFRRELVVSGGLAFSGTFVIDPATRTRVGQFVIAPPPASLEGYSVVPDARTRRVYFFVNSFSSSPTLPSGLSLLAFDFDRYVRLDIVRLPASSGVIFPHAAIQLGAGGLALIVGDRFNTSLRRLAFIDSAFIVEPR